MKRRHGLLIGSVLIAAGLYWLYQKNQAAKLASAPATTVPPALPPPPMAAQPVTSSTVAMPSITNNVVYDDIPEPTLQDALVIPSTGYIP